MSEIDLGRLREVAEHEPGRDYWTLDNGDEALGAFRPSVILALLDRLERAEAAVERAARLADAWLNITLDMPDEPWSGPLRHRSEELNAALGSLQDDDGPQGQQDATRRQEGAL